MSRQFCYAILQPETFSVTSGIGQSSRQRNRGCVKTECKKSLMVKHDKNFNIHNIEHTYAFTMNKYANI